MASASEEFIEIDRLYDECLNYLEFIKNPDKNDENLMETDNDEIDFDEETELIDRHETEYIIVNEKDSSKLKSKEDSSIEFKDGNANANKVDGHVNEANNNNALQIYKPKNDKKKDDKDASVNNSNRLRRYSKQLPKIIITQSNNSLSKGKDYMEVNDVNNIPSSIRSRKNNSSQLRPYRPGYGDYPKRLVSKSGVENVAVISNVPFEKIRMLNDTFHTLINLRWRWIVIFTIVLHFSIWLVFAVLWYIAALAHYDFDPDPPKKACVTGGVDFVTIFLASVEAQTTIGFGDRTIDEECPEAIFLFIMQLILGTGLSGVLTCIVYAKLTRPEKLSRDGVGFSKKAVISVRDGELCLMIRAWDLNYDHIINSEFKAHFVKTHKTKEGEIIRYFAKTLELSHRQFLLWPITLIHVIDENSPLYEMGPLQFERFSYEITVSLKGASASMGTFTQSQTSYLPKEVVWGHRFPSVVKYDYRKQKYVINHKKLDVILPVDTPLCSAKQMKSSFLVRSSSAPATPSCFSEKISGFHLERSSSFRRIKSGIS